MADDLIPLRTYAASLEANLARNALLDADIRAVLADETTIDTDFFLSNAIGGVKLLVRSEDVERAEAVLNDLAEVEPHETGDPTPEEDEVDVSPNTREALAHRAFKGAILGLLFLPIQVYIFWLLLRVFVSEEPMRWEYQMRAFGAAVINIPAVLLFGFLVRISIGM